MEELERLRQSLHGDFWTTDRTDYAQDGADGVRFQVVKDVRGDLEWYGWVAKLDGHTETRSKQSAPSVAGAKEDLKLAVLERVNELDTQETFPQTEGFVDESEE